MAKMSLYPEVVRPDYDDSFVVVSSNRTKKLSIGNLTGSEFHVNKSNASPSVATASIQAAVDAANAVGGGVVYIPEGTFIVEGVTLYDGVHIVGVGATEDHSGETILTLPATPAADMFSFAAQNDAVGGGIHNISADGIDSSYDFVSFENIVDDIFLFALTGNHIKNFRRGFDSEGADCRSPRINGNKFLDCTVGVYVGAEHPLFESLNEFRSCTAGITGSLIHCLVNNQKFAYCTDAIVPAAGATITNSEFVGNSVYYNTRGITVNSRCNISGNLFGPIDTTESLVKAGGSSVNITGNIFIEESDTFTCSDGCIVIDNSSAVIRDINITGNSSQVEGTFALVDSVTWAVKSLNLSNNDLLFLGNGKAIDDGGAQVQYHAVRNNTITTSNNSFDFTTTLIKLGNNNNSGGVVVGNIFAATEGGNNDEWIALDLDARSVVVNGNFFRRGGLYISDSDSNTVLTDNIFKENVKTGAGAADTIGYNLIDGSGGVYTLTLANGSTDGDDMRFTCIAAGNDVTLTVANHLSGAPTNFTFNAIGDSLDLEWDAGNGYWTTTRSDGV